MIARGKYWVSGDMLPLDLVWQVRKLHKPNMHQRKILHFLCGTPPWIAKKKTNSTQLYSLNFNSESKLIQEYSFLWWTSLKTVWNSSTLTSITSFWNIKSLMINLSLYLPKNFKSKSSVNRYELSTLSNLNLEIHYNPSNHQVEVLKRRLDKTIYPWL